MHEALPSPASTYLPQNLEPVASISALTSIVVANPFRGEKTYLLCVPPNVPVKEFWALTVYDSETQALFLNSPRPTLDALDKGKRRNADGSVDLYMGPKAPTGQEANWIYTPAGKSWFPWFRFYGPEKALFDKSWTMPDIAQVK
jgi:hypothetical protein